MGVTGSLVLAADDPAALASFCGALLEVEPLSGLSSTHWRVPWPVGGFLEIDQSLPLQALTQAQGHGTLCPGAIQGGQKSVG